MNIRRVQRVNISLYVNIPISIARELDIESGDRVKIMSYNNEIIIAKLKDLSAVNRPQFIKRNP